MRGLVSEWTGDIPYINSPTIAGRALRMSGRAKPRFKGESGMPKIEHRTLNDRAYEQIKKGLISGAFRSGQTLVIRTLAETYGISTTPVREALQRLVAERHLELLPNRSIVVPLLDVD